MDSLFTTSEPPCSLDVGHEVSEKDAGKVVEMTRHASRSVCVEGSKRKRSKRKRQERPVPPLIRLLSERKGKGKGKVVEMTRHASRAVSEEGSKRELEERQVPWLMGELSKGKGKGKDVDGQEVWEKDAGKVVEMTRHASRSVSVEESKRKLEKRRVPWLTRELSNGKGKDVDGQEVLEKDVDQAVERTRYATRSVGVKEFRRKVEEGCEDGYFVSSKWLLELEKHERESLMSVLWRTGYSEICQATTTTLFARIEDDVQHQSTYNGASSTFTENYVCRGPTQELGVPMGVDDQPGIAGPAKKKEKSEIPSDEVLQNKIRGLTKNLNSGEFSKVTDMDVCSQLREQLNLDLSIKEAAVELLVKQRCGEEIGFFEDENEKANKGTKIVLEEDVDEKADKAAEVDGEPRAAEPEGEPIDTTEAAEKANAPNGKETAKGIEIDSVRDSDVGISIKHGMDLRYPFGLSQDVPPWLQPRSPHSTNVSNIFFSEQEAATLQPLQVALKRDTEHSFFAETLESLQAALKSNTHRMLCVNTKWFSKLKDNEKEALDRLYLQAGYEKIYQTSSTTWYVGSGGHVKNPADGGDPCGTNSLTLSDKKYAPCGDISRPRTSKRVALGWDEMLTMQKKHEANIFVGLAREMSTSHIPCHPQLLSVVCSSSSHTSMHPPTRDGQFRRQQVGDTVVKMPPRDQLKKLSTTMNRSFPMKTIDFLSDGRGEEVFVNLKVTTITSLGCCCLPGTDHNLPKVHIKFSRIYGEVTNENSNEQPCNAMALSCVSTSLGGFVVTRLGGGDDLEEITLTLEDVYHPPQRRVISTSQQVGTSSTNGLVWLAMSDKIIDPSNSLPESVTVELRGDVGRRRKADLDTGVQRAHILHFQDSKPLIFDGNIAIHPTSFLELHMRHQLEVSYFKPSVPIHENTPVWSAESTSKVIDLDLYLKIRNENFEFG